MAVPVRCNDPEQCVEATLSRVGNHIVLGLPVAPLAAADSLTGLAGPAGMLQPVDRDIVQKANRRMDLMRAGAV